MGRNKVLLLSGLISTGKDTVAKYLVENHSYRMCVSHTTRDKRQGEVEGKNYFFIDKEKFYKMAENNEFVEMRKYFVNIDVGNGESKRGLYLYGLSKQQLKDRSKPIVIIADKEGCEEIRRYVGECKWVHLECDIDVIKQRAIARGDFSAEIDRRIENDLIRFKGIEMVADRIVDSNRELEEVVEDILK